MATTLKEARAILKSYGVNSLLSDPTSNPKLEKSLKLRVLSAPLHLAPASLSGWNVCPMATAGCRQACLHTAGNPIYMPNKAKARLARTTAYYRDREAFMTLLCAEIDAHRRRARKRRMRCAVRLNATSDIRWETIPVSWKGKTYANIMCAFPRIQFYDYTKIANRKHLPPNYHLTFSLAENNDRNAFAAHNRGVNVAVVFDVRKGQPLPRSYDLCGASVDVIDGDEHDYRPADPKRHYGVIVGLRAKGKAIGDTSGFVRSVVNYNDTQSQKGNESHVRHD